ncbi:alpha/beta-hydrolase [Hypoxylon sp. FL0543]|nr:alpha/beta-hydrolase [Hypoxylon sp. FL0543]
MSKPSILLVPGSFSLPELYDNVLKAVTDKGYEIKALHYPTVGLKAGPRPEELPSMYDDAAFIAKEVASLADEGKDVVLIAHSYGGIPATQSTKGLTKAERQEQGKKGGIVRLAYMTALVPALGESSVNLLEKHPAENRVETGVDDKGWLYIADIPAAGLVTISDLPDKAEREAWVEKFQTQSSVSFSNELTHAGYKDVPVSYLFCEDDLCVTPQVQKEAIETIERESRRKVDVTSIKAGHCPSVTVPEKVVEWIVHTAAKSEGV